MSKRKNNSAQAPNSPQVTKYRSSEIVKVFVIVVAVLIIVGVIVPIVFGVVFMLFSVYSGTHVDESTVRKLWAETGMANSEYYHFTEIESKATDDTIYLELEDIPGEITWGCGVSGLARSCGMSFSDGGGMPNGGNDLGGYFWGKHWSEIEDILEKYPGLSERLKYRIEVYDMTELEKFAQEILEIPEIEKLYQAYKAESERSGSYDAAQEFAYAYVDFMQENGEKSDVAFLFEWMEDQGM